jgi:hypothetical protein
MAILGNALKEQFPHKRHNSEEMFGYLKNLLLVSYYAPSLIESIITTAVDRLIQIDVIPSPLLYFPPLTNLTSLTRSTLS